MKNHVAGAVKDKLLKELEGHTGETDSEDSEDETEAKNKAENEVTVIFWLFTMHPCCGTAAIQ